MNAPANITTTSGGGPRPSWPPSRGDDCSNGVCTFNCPQWCGSIIFSTPPPFDDSPSGPSLSPLVIAVIVGIIASFVLLAAYALIFRRRRRQPWRRTTLSASSANLDTSHGDPAAVAAAPAATHVDGLDESLINRIAACRYRRADGLVGGTECAVCLMEFGEGESLRLLPECAHAFHIPCIDTWLKAHSNCPVCRTGIVWANPPVEERVVVVVDGAEAVGARTQRAGNNSRTSNHA